MPWPRTRRRNRSAGTRIHGAALAEWVCGFGSWGTAVVAVFLVSSSAATPGVSALMEKAPWVRWKYVRPG
ncbi:hypothetical protein ACWDUB_32390, partial [Streptomyces fungicidicus]